MSARPPISAVLITLNGGRHLDAVLAPLAAACAEIVVLDSGSTDRTLEIARAHGARIAHQPFLGYGPQKRAACALARHDWILSIDADEILDPRAAAALAGLDLGDARRCWRIRRRNHIGAQEVRHGVWSPDRCLRLFNRTATGFGDDPVHEAVAPAGPVEDLPGSLLHFGFEDCADVLARTGRYARAKAARYRARGRRAGALLLLARMAAGFLRSYVLKRGFLDGRLGVVVALSVAADAVIPLADAQAPGEGSPSRP